MNERYALIIRSERSPVPVTIWLRHLLKGMLRQLGFRCESARELPPRAKAS
jgi:hypothetical protein